MNQQGKRFSVQGRVQGVYYRANTQQKARELGITGWVANLPDGRVEVYAFGTEEQLAALGAWLWQGPALARVEAVIEYEVSWQACQDFLINE